jgi:hypothetical protein
MSNDTHHAHQSHGGFERRDVGVPGVLYFLLGLAVFGLITYFLVNRLYHLLENQTEAQQAPVSPLVTNAARDTRHLPPEYSGDYEKYLQNNFPAPQLEIDERTELDKERLREEQILSSYDYVDQKAGSVRIPIDRAMDLIAQRGLPVRSQSGDSSAASSPKARKATK